MVLREVKPRDGLMFAGAEYLPALQFQGAGNDISGTSAMSFRARGDGKTYMVSLFDPSGSATTKYFIAGKDWSEVVFPFSAFGSDGKHVAVVQIASAVPGLFRLELADPSNRGASKARNRARQRSERRQNHRRERQFSSVKGGLETTRRDHRFQSQ